ncbi:MAG: chromosomal replication initiator protein DnaA [Mollicutes bacterium]|jgi:chromosomal replication initiator protein|nr:chromosomal replication initiator protein DnaA [Mollicutes bacterium]
MENNMLWENFLNVLKSKISSVSFDTWFKDTKLLKQDNCKLVIQVPMTFHKKFLNDTYYDLIDEIISGLTGNSYDLEFIVEEEVIEEEKKEKEEIKDLDLNFNSNLNPRYTFANFVIGESNRFAQTAAVAVAEQPGKIYNPLFIHGKSGLGKTHLMHAIGNYVKENSEKKVLYVTSEEFIADFIGINKKIENNYDVVDYFKQKYRNIDVLLIDDIQFLGSAEKTQAEFFHTFNTLYDSNKQIIISSDRSPDDLKLLEERLRTRFRWGLTVDIYPPNFELRCKILKDKMLGHEVASLVKEEVIEYIATNCENDVRHLEGAITRLYAYAAIMGPKEINLDFAVEALKDYIGKSIYITNNITKIQKAIADYYHITIDDLKSKKRNANISYPRQVAMYLCRMTTEETIVKIGLEFGNRDHSTVLHACDKITQELKINEELKKIIEEIKNNIVN